MRKSTRKSKLWLFMLLAMLVGGGNAAWADTVTVCDGTTQNDKVPFDGYNADSQQHNQMIYPASALNSIAGKDITKMVFYYSSIGSGGSGPGEWTVKLGTTTATALDGLDTTTELTEVFSGALTFDEAAKTMTITFDNAYTYNGDNLLVDFSNTTLKWKTITFYGIEAAGASYTYNSQRNFLPKVTFETPVIGPGLAVYDGSNMLESDYSYSFGLATTEATKEFTLKNPGTESITLNIAATNGFGVSPASTTIEAKGETTLTVTMADATATGVVTITPTAEGIDAFTINVSGTLRDPNKVYETLLDGSIPDEWTTSGGTWSWSATNGASNTAWYESSNYRLITPKLTIAEGETFFFDAQGTYNSYQGVIFEYSADGTTWTASSAATAVSSEWQTFTISDIPAGSYYIALHGWHVNLRNFYGGELAQEPKMTVTQPSSLDFGVIDSDDTKTFTIANTGKVTLENIAVSSDNSAFTITGVPTSLEAGASQEVTITMSAASIGSFSGKITVSAPEQTTVEFTVTGTVLPTGLTVIDFNDNKIPNDRWTTEGSYMSFSGGAAVFGSNWGGEAKLTTPKITMGQYLVVKAKLDYNSTSYYLTVKGSTDNGETYSYSNKLAATYGNGYEYFVLSDIPADVNKLQFQGYNASIDEIQGINYAPELTVTLDGETVASPASYDFEECTADATVTYDFANIGEGELNITGVAITGDGAAAYSTNWTESVAAPFGLIITRAYDASRNGTAQNATVTVTTTDGEFVIDVTGTDHAANAPELAIDAESLDFGKLAGNDTKTITVTNAGTGSMTVNIASDNTLFTVSPAQLTDIAAGESKTFDVTFNYDQATTYGTLTANITVTPTYDETAAKTIALTVKAKDPDTWFEYFDDDQVADRGWSMDDGWSIADGKAVAGGSMSKYLTTPYLTVTSADEELTFDYQVTSTYATYIYYYTKKDDGNWSDLKYISGAANSNGSFTFTGLEPGTYQFRFSGNNFKLDNFEGFKRFIPEHDAEISAVTIPATGYKDREYTATVTVKEKAGKEEAATAKLYIGENEMATATATLAANGETEIALTFTPSEAVSYQNAKIVVTYAGGDLTSESKYVTVKDVIVFDEETANTITAGNMQAVLLKRKFIAGWNTLCLPFGISDPKKVFGDGVSAYTFTSYSDEAGLGFTATNLSNGLDAGVPYLLYVPEAIDEDLFFESVSISATMRDAVKGSVTFKGTYSPMGAGELTGYYVVTKGEDARIAKCSDKATLKAFRAYFINESSDGNARMSIRFNDGTTGIAAMTADGELEAGTLYNLQGQKVQGTRKGLYIIRSAEGRLQGKNGKKVVKK